MSKLFTNLAVGACGGLLVLGGAAIGAAVVELVSVGSEPEITEFPSLPQLGETPEEGVNSVGRPFQPEVRTDVCRDFYNLGSVPSEDWNGNGALDMEDEIKYCVQ